MKILDPLLTRVSILWIISVPNFFAKLSVTAAESSNPSSVFIIATFAKVPTLAAKLPDSPIDLENDFGSYANTSPALNVFPLVRSVSNCIDT